MYVCMYVCMYVSMYVRMYVLSLLKYRYVLEYSYIAIFSGFFTASCGTEPIHRHKRRHVSFAISFYFLLLPFLASAKSCIYVSSLTSAHVCVLTVHAQCTYSARTVHGHSARARNAANTTENGP